MSPFKDKKFSLIGVCLCFLASATLLADDDIDADLVQAVLADQATYRANNVTLENVFIGMSQRMGVKIDLKQAVPAFAQLPQGRLMEIESLQFDGLTWRQALNNLLKPFALTHQEGEDSIIILGTPELLRQPRRLTLSELDALVQLQNTSLDFSDDKLVDQMQQRSGLKLRLYVHNKGVKRIDREDVRRVLDAGPENICQALDFYSKRIYRRGEPSVWFFKEVIENNEAFIDIRIVSKEEMITLKLDQRIDIQFNGIPVKNVLLRLAQRAAVDIRFEPGCIALVDPAIRDHMTLSMQSGSIKEALELIVGMTGLTYHFNYDGLLILASENLKKMATAPRTVSSGDKSYVFLMESGGMIMPIWPEDIPEKELLEKIKELRGKNLEIFKQMLRDLPIN